jgi:hypothetical protein
MANGWLIKPLDALRLRRAAQTILAGGSYPEGLPADAVSPGEGEAGDATPAADGNGPTGPEAATG